MRSGLVSIAAALGAALLGCGSKSGAGQDASGAGGSGTGGAGGTSIASGGAGSSGGATGAAATGGGSAAGSGGTPGSGGDSAGSAGSVGTGRGGGVAGTGAAGSAGGGAGGTGGKAAPLGLDMNDVTILVPLPQLVASPQVATPVLLRGTDLADDGTAMVPRALYDRLVRDIVFGQEQDLIPSRNYDQLHLVAVRFDLCDRHRPGLCPEAEDARIRLVFQPITDIGASDIGFHAFYTVRNDEMAGAVAALRDLAKLAPAQAGALRVSPALSGATHDAYASTLRAFVTRYGGDTRLVRLTMNAQPSVFAQVRWTLRGVEQKDGAFVDMTIVGSTTATKDEVFLSTPAAYDIMPISDMPSGILGAITKKMFDMADPPTKLSYVAALAAAENPLTHSTETVACFACHVSTVVTRARSDEAAIDPLTLPGRYTSTFDLSTAAGKSAETDGTLRAFGYVRTIPLISQRVANETAQTLTEIQARFPGP